MDASRKWKRLAGSSTYRAIKSALVASDQGKMHMLRSNLRKAKRKYPEAIVPIIIPQVSVEDPRTRINRLDNGLTFPCMCWYPCRRYHENSAITGTIIDMGQDV